MKYLKIPFLLIWRLWFYILMTVGIIVMLPLLLVYTSDEKYYPKFWKCVRAISYLLVYGMGFRIKAQIDQETEPDKSYVFCPNHASFMDPFVLAILSKNPIVFIGKKELVKIPIFGFFYKRAIIMVDRSSHKSRKRVFLMAKKRLKNGTSIVIFPEGLVPEEHVVLAPFKKGAFSLAIEHQIPIVPHVYYDCKRLFSWDFFKGGPGTLRVRQHKFIETKGMTLKDVDRLKDKTYQIIYNDLIQDEKYMKDTLHAKK